MSFRPTAQALIAPNIFDAYANPNLLLYLVAGNLLSPATWDLSSKIQQRVLAAVGDQVRPVEDEELAVNTKLSVPTPNLMNVLPAPTKISPFVYELYPVPP